MKAITFVPLNWPWYKLYPRAATEGKPVAWCKCDCPCDADPDNGIFPDTSICILCSCYTTKELSIKRD